MAINELQDFRLNDLYEKLRLGDEEFEDWLVSMNLLNGSMQCTCGSQMKLIFHNGVKNWKCNRRTPEHTKGLMKGYKVGTFFEHAHLSCKDVFKLSYFWAMKHSIEYAEFETQIVHHIIVEWYKRFRSVCSHYFRVNPVQLGGANLTVCLLFL